MGRLKPGVTLQKAQADLAVVAKHLAEEAKAEHLAAYRPLREKLRGRAAPILALLFAAVATVLLIAAVNLANVMLARASGRAREFAVRRALGAPLGGSRGSFSSRPAARPLRRRVGPLALAVGPRRRAARLAFLAAEPA